MPNEILEKLIKRRVSNFFIKNRYTPKMGVFYAIAFRIGIEDVLKEYEFFDMGILEKADLHYVIKSTLPSMGDVEKKVFDAGRQDGTRYFQVTLGDLSQAFAYHKKFNLTAQLSERLLEEYENLIHSICDLLASHYGVNLVNIDRYRNLAPGNLNPVSKAKDFSYEKALLN